MRRRKSKEKECIEAAVQTPIHRRSDGGRQQRLWRDEREKREEGEREKRGDAAEPGQHSGALGEMAREMLEMMSRRRRCSFAGGVTTGVKHAD